MPKKFTFSSEPGDDDDSILAAASSILADDDGGNGNNNTNDTHEKKVKQKSKIADSFSCFECGTDPSLVLEPHSMSTLGDHVVIIGAGAIGGFVGCCLYESLHKQKGSAVQFLVRDPSQIERYSRTGFTARATLDPHFEATIPPEDIGMVFTTDASSCLKEATCIFVATKRMSNPAIHRMLCNYELTCPVVFLQNGIRIREEDLAEEITVKRGGQVHVIRRRYQAIEAVVTMNVDLDKEQGTLTVSQPLQDAFIVLGGKQQERLQPQEQEESQQCNNTGGLVSDISDAVCQLFETCPIPAYAEKKHDLISLQAAKLQMNMMNSINALSGVPIAQTLQASGYRQVLAHCIDECRAAFAAHGIAMQAVGPEMSNLSLKIMPILLRSWDSIFMTVMGSKLKLLQGRSSMAQDLDNRVSKTEIEFLNGAVVRLGYEAGVPTPINARIVELVQRAESLELGSPRLSPDSLLLEVGLIRQLAPSPGRIYAVDPPSLMSFRDVQDELIDNTYSSGSSSSAAANTPPSFRRRSTQKGSTSGGKSSPIPNRVRQMLRMTVLSSETMLPYVQTPPMSPTTTITHEAVLTSVAAVTSPVSTASTAQDMRQEFVMSYDRSVRLWN